MRWIGVKDFYKKKSVVFKPLKSYTEASFISTILEFDQQIRTIEDCDWVSDLPDWFKDDSQEMLLGLSNEPPTHEASLGHICARFSRMLSQLFVEKPELRHTEKVFYKCPYSCSKDSKKSIREQKDSGKEWIIRLLKHL